MDQILKDAAQHGDIDGLYSSIEMDAYVLKKIDDIPFVQTPLHIALAAGQADFAMEIMKLQPSFAKKLNQNGDSPVHLALRRGQTPVVLRLLNVDEDIVRIQGKHGLTPLHNAAQTGNLELLVEFLKACPRSIEDVTSRNENVLHVALKNEKYDAFKLLLGWLQRSWFWNASLWEKKLLNWQDHEGNTVLHIAVSKNQPKIVQRLLRIKGPFRIIDTETKNSRGLSAFELAQGQQIREMVRPRAKFSSIWPFQYKSDINFFMSPKKPHEALSVFFLRERTKLPNDTRNMLLVVCALLITVIFQATVTPPGGVWQDDSPFHGAGMATMDDSLFFVLTILNLISFLLTIFATIILLPIRRAIFSIPLYLLCTFFAAAIDITAPTETPIFLYQITYLGFFLPLLLLAFEVLWDLGVRRLFHYFRSDYKGVDPSFFNVY